MKKTIEIPLPEGYAYVGYRAAGLGEFIYDLTEQKVMQLGAYTNKKFHVIEKFAKTHRIYETTGEYRRVKPDEYYSDSLDGLIQFRDKRIHGDELTKNSYHIWQIVERPQNWKDRRTFSVNSLSAQLANTPPFTVCSRHTGF